MKSTYIIHPAGPGCKFLSGHCDSDGKFFAAVIGLPHPEGKVSGVQMMMETYLRRGQRNLERLALSPKVRTLAVILGCSGSGLLLSAVGLGNLPQPVAMGLLCSASGWRALLMMLGAIVGYPTFWGMAGNQGIVWATAGGLLAILVNRKPESRDQPLMLPVVAGFLTVISDLGFRLILRENTPFFQLPLRAAVACFSGILFTQASRCRDPVTDWLVEGVLVLALAQLSLGRWLGLGYLAAGLMAVGAAFPAAALAGLALDVSRITRVPMGAVMCLAYFLRMIPHDRRWQQLAAPAAAYVGIALVCGLWDPHPLPGLVFGGVLGGLLPPKPQIAHRRGETGVAQVRLELSAQVLMQTRQLLLEMPSPPIDREALVQKARQRACMGCSLRRTCAQQKNLSVDLLENPLEADCRKQGRLVPELRRAGDHLRILQADRKRQREYRSALAQQYGFLSGYLRNLSDRLPRKAEYPKVEFRIELSARSRGKEAANGDRCYAFAGDNCRYYVLLCDGMGTGLGAAQEGQDAGILLRQMLGAGFPAEHALKTVNSLLALRGAAGAATMDLAEISLETGIVHIYKWGAAPSWVLTRRGAEKIGTATPPPGIGVETIRMAVEKLSLRRGEVLILLSDGVEGEEIPQLSELSADEPPGVLAAKILEQCCGQEEDDATAAVLRLRPAGMSTS